ncbi:MAG: hypothetical protein KZQ58_11810 [gamma proteobacterium symbiont of Bathyaustriella thionipta]|nr:hypothetical protein [gamma proteobacterium symbiont of Bathyaustriella thionipta]
MKIPTREESKLTSRGPLDTGAKFIYRESSILPVLQDAADIALGKYGAPGWTLIVSEIEKKSSVELNLKHQFDSKHQIEDRISVWEDVCINIEYTKGLIVEAYKNDPPAMIVFDPIGGFDYDDSAVLAAANEIATGLDCTVLLIARRKTSDIQTSDIQTLNEASIYLFDGDDGAHWYPDVISAARRMYREDKPAFYRKRKDFEKASEYARIDEWMELIKADDG